MTSTQSILVSFFLYFLFYGIPLTWAAHGPKCNFGPLDVEPLVAPHFPPEQIHYLEKGIGNKETLILIHGLDSAHQTFFPIIDKLAEKFHVIAYDQRGHGRTPAVGNDYSSLTMANDLRGLMDHLGIDQAHILGHSMGARTAVRFAALFPDRVKSVIVEDMEMIAREKNNTKDITQNLKAAEKARKEFEGVTFPNRKALENALRLYYGNEANSLTHRRAKENPDGSMTLFFRPWVGMMYGHQGNIEDFSGHLKNVKAPLLFIASDPKMGTAMSTQGRRHVVQQRPDADLVVIEGSGHVVHGGKTTGQFLEILGHFLEKGKISPEMKGK